MVGFSKGVVKKQGPAFPQELPKAVAEVSAGKADESFVRVRGEAVGKAAELAPEVLLAPANILHEANRDRERLLALFAQLTEVGLKVFGGRGESVAVSGETRLLVSGYQP